ncbi:MAG: hypothetical protein LBK42_02015 [Propionibacteriaceae bacterium]|jgi:hypothetical protein|nr:hypothetical protein [Propionibacteriaceae bacterium]
MNPDQAARAAEAIAKKHVTNLVLDREGGENLFEVVCACGWRRRAPDRCQRSTSPAGDEVLYTWHKQVSRAHAAYKALTQRADPTLYDVMARVDGKDAVACLVARRRDDKITWELHAQGIDADQLCKQLVYLALDVMAEAGHSRRETITAVGEVLTQSGTVRDFNLLKGNNQ